MKKARIFTAIWVCIWTLTGHVPSTTYSSSIVPPSARPSAAQIMFDDFSYASGAELAKNGWIIRTAQGWPGVPGAVWGPEAVSLHDDPLLPGNRLLKMTASTDGTRDNTRQAQICHQRKYLEGTYAARVRFTDAPISGPNGDQVVQSFYAISPLASPMDSGYSELDFEYLPNGGWGVAGPTFYQTTWETFSPEPNWKADNVSAHVGGSQAGWHTLVMQVAGAGVRYFLDGKLQAEHGGRFYPESLMSINFNLWFIKEGLGQAKAKRSYEEDLDWVFFQKDKVLAPGEVENLVNKMRREVVKFTDTVAEPTPALTSPCNF